jgi:hypothetical protein
MATLYEPQVAQMNEESVLESYLDLTLIHHFRDEDLNCKKWALVLKLIPLELGTITFFQTLEPW